MLIRPCRPGEEAALLALFRSSVHVLAARDYTPEQIEAWCPRAPGPALRETWLARIRENRPWVVEIDASLAAFADLQPSGHIDQFFVAPDVAGRGIGAALMRHLHEVAVARGVARLSAHVSLTAQPLFRRFGFVVEQEQEAVVRGVALRNALMCKTLDGRSVDPVSCPPGRASA